MSFLLADSRQWRPQMAENLELRTGKRFHRLTSPEELTAENVCALQIERAFFPHWSHRIPETIFTKIDCVIFHMTDLPFGRGGSPLQNLIVRSIRQTKICALRCVAELDAGPVYLRRPLSLDGSAQEIYVAASAIIEDMIVEIVQRRPQPVPQTGTPTVFKRRQPADGDIAALCELKKVYDFIRMLDADGYPRAFLETDGLRLEFSRARLSGEQVMAEVTITRKSHGK